MGSHNDSLETEALYLKALREKVKFQLPFIPIFRSQSISMPIVRDWEFVMYCWT